MYIKEGFMKKINKIGNIALIFTLIGVFLSSDPIYASSISCLRVPLQTSKLRERFIIRKSEEILKAWEGGEAENLRQELEKIGLNFDEIKEKLQKLVINEEVMPVINNQRFRMIRAGGSKIFVSLDNKDVGICIKENRAEETHISNFELVKEALGGILLPSVILESSKFGQHEIKLENGQEVPLDNRVIIKFVIDKDQSGDFIKDRIGPLNAKAEKRGYTISEDTTSDDYGVFQGKLYLLDEHCVDESYHVPAEKDPLKEVVLYAQKQETRQKQLGYLKGLILKHWNKVTSQASTWQPSPVEKTVYECWRALVAGDENRVRQILEDFAQSTPVLVKHRFIGPRDLIEIRKNCSHNRPTLCGAELIIEDFVRGKFECKHFYCAVLAVENILQHVVSWPTEDEALILMFEHNIKETTDHNEYWVYVIDSGLGMPVGEVIAGDYSTPRIDSEERAIKYLLETSDEMQDWTIVSLKEQWNQASRTLTTPLFLTPPKGTLFAAHIVISNNLAIPLTVKSSLNNASPTDL